MGREVLGVLPGALSLVVKELLWMVKKSALFLLIRTSRHDRTMLTGDEEMHLVFEFEERECLVK